MRGARGRSAERGIALAVAAAAVAAIGGGAFDLVRERDVWRSQQLLDAQGLALARGDAVIADAGPANDSARPAALVNLALVDARAAEASHDPATRTRLLARASRSIAVAQRGRPRWGEAELVAAYIAAARNGNTAAPPVLARLAASYRDAPLVRHGGAWRVGVGLARYCLLDRETRARVIEEAVWLARVDNPSRTAIFDRARGSAGYRDLVARWHAARLGDADTATRRPPAIAR